MNSLGIRWPSELWRSVPIVVELPALDLRARVLDRHELHDVKAFVAQLAVERLDVPVFHGLSGSDKVELHTVTPRPVLERLGREFRAMIDGDRRGNGTSAGRASMASATRWPDIAKATSSNGLARLN